MLMLDEVFFRN